MTLTSLTMPPYWDTETWTEVRRSVVTTVTSVLLCLIPGYWGTGEGTNSVTPFIFSEVLCHSLQTSNSQCQLDSEESKVNNESQYEIYLF